MRILKLMKLLLLGLIAPCCVLIFAGFNPFNTKYVFGNRQTTDEMKTAEVIMERFRQRHAHVTSVCNVKRHEINVSECVLNRAKANFNYIPSEKIIVCTVEKTGSSFLKKILLSIGPNIQFSKESSWERLRGTMERPVTVMQTRSPYTRLFSAWLDKMYSTNPYYWKDVGTKVVKAVRKNATEHERECGHDVTFLEFVTYMLHTLKIDPCSDGHFTSVYDHCLPCSVEYDYIVQYETYKEDIMFLLNNLKLKEKVKKVADFDNASVTDAIADAANWVFAMKHNIKPCMSFQCGLFRVWKRLQGRGVIAIDAEFPYDTAEKADSLTEAEFFKTLLSVSSSSMDTPEEGARYLALSEAYSSVPRETIELLQDVFQLDFDVFGYEKNPPFTRESSNAPHQKVTGRCPF